MIFSIHISQSLQNVVVSILVPRHGSFDRRLVILEHASVAFQKLERRDVVNQLFNRLRTPDPIPMKSYMGKTRLPVRF